ncbi:MAG: serine/threonine protein kinase [Deltaproteobacteria bacterium]|nr:MAG: serine/threonine protein kinase [Deltaproteobacteria bacterium]
MMQVKLLVVESDIESGQLLKQYLQQQSYAVTLTPSVEEARQALLKDVPTVMLVDLDDAKQPWSTFYSWLRQQSSLVDLPCIWFVSQFNDFALSLQNQPKNYVLQKPMDPDQFLRVIEANAAKEKETHFTAAPKSTSPEDPSLAAWVQSLKGRELGSVILEEEIGRGGMGVVFRGQQRSLHRQVAVKIMLPHLTKKLSTVERFQREALATAKLKSPHIVQIFEAGTTKDKMFYIVMEWLAGETLEQRVKRQGKLEPLEALDIVMQTAEGLRTAHAAGLIHRDLKPSNLIVSEDGHISITDFGLVFNQQLPRHTQSGIVVGTPHYLSPEQASGQAIDVRSDVYSLGILFFELLTGHVPFQSNNLTDLLIAHVQKPLPNPKAHVPDLPDAFVPVLQSMTAKDPNHRYQNTEALHQALRQLHTTVTQGPVSPFHQGGHEVEPIWQPEPEPLQDKDLLKTQVVTPMQANQSSLFLSHDASLNEFYKRAASLAPSSLTPSSPQWNELNMEGMLLVDSHGNLLMQEGAIQAQWHTALAVLLGHASQISSAVDLAEWQFSILEGPYASMFVLPRQGHQFQAILRPPREHPTPIAPNASAAEVGSALSRMVQSLHALAGVTNILLYDTMVQLMDARLSPQTDPHDYPLKISPIIHMLQSMPWERTRLTCRFSGGLMRFWPLPGAFLCVQTTPQCNQSLLTMMVQRQLQSASVSPESMAASPHNTPYPPTPSSHPSPAAPMTPHYGMGASSHGGHHSSQPGHPNYMYGTSHPSSPPVGHAGMGVSGVQQQTPGVASSGQVPMSSSGSIAPAFSASSTSAFAPVQSANPGDCLSPEMMQELTKLFSRYAGPIGKMVISKTAKRMGYTAEQFPADLASAMFDQLAGRIGLDKRPEFIKSCRKLLSTHRAHS